MACKRGQLAGRVVADADEDPGREGDGQLARGLQRGQPAGRRLVGRAAVRGQPLGERLEHHPLAGRHLAQPCASSSGKRAPALAWGSRPVSSRTSRHIAAR